MRKQYCRSDELGSVIPQPSGNVHALVQDASHPDGSVIKLLEEDEMMGVLDEMNALQGCMPDRPPSIPVLCMVLDGFNEFPDLFVRLQFTPSGFRIVPDLDDPRLGGGKDSNFHRRVCRI